MRRSRRKIRRTCPQCGLPTLTRIVDYGGVFGALRLVSRFCVNCQYSDGHGWELSPTSEDAALGMARALGEGSIRLHRETPPRGRSET